MLKVSRRFSIRGHHGPFVFKYACLGCPHVDHGFNGQGHASFETRTFAFFTVVRHLRLFVELPANTMTNELTHNCVPILDDMLLNTVAKIAKHPTIAGVFDRIEK